MDNHGVKNAKGGWGKQRLCLAIGVFVSTSLLFMYGYRPTHPSLIVTKVSTDSGTSEIQSYSIRLILTKAVTVLTGPDPSVGGTVTFTQTDPSASVTIVGDLHGLSPLKKQGFHIQYVSQVYEYYCTYMNICPQRVGRPLRRVSYRGSALQPIR